MVWTKLDEERRLCEAWLKEPLTNPQTGRPIERRGPTYEYWREKCKEHGIQSRPVATREMTWRKCQEWRRDPLVNPDTGRKIKKDGKVYKQIAAQCKLITEREIKLQGEYYKPDKKGMVPGVRSNGTMYVVRQFDNRKVWGPLNKKAGAVRLYYYKDTWDYHYNHYRPVFINGDPPRPKLQVKTRKIEPQRKNPKYVVDSIVDLFVSK